MRPVVAAALVLLLALPAAARDLTSVEEAALVERVDEFNAAIDGRNFETVLSIVPPRIYETIAEQHGIDVATLRAVVVDQMEEIFEEATLEEFDMRVTDAERRTLEDGTPYLLLPTTTVVEAEGVGRMRFENATLALLDEGTWYLLRLDDPNQAAILQQTYPGFAGVELPRGTITPLDDQ
ncbi:hypothetical protein [Acuticoccus sp.]|uniref:hypothetical protein n=1 Tax=Acuticoccus sp. TaxID=1904378 RepID=UPI003B52E673